MDSTACYPDDIIVKREKLLQLALGKTVRQLRMDAGKSQEQLAADANLNRSYLGDVERGEKNISLSNLDKLARALGMSAGELLKRSEGEK